MPLPVIDKTYRISAMWSDTNSGRTAVNVFHVRTPGVSTAVTVGSNILANVTQAMWDWAAGTCAIDKFVVLPLDGVTAGVEVATARPAKCTGGGLGESIPQVAGIVKFGTGLRGPAHRGRIFIPFVGEGEQSGGRLIDVAAVAAAWAAFNTALAASTSAAVLVVASYKLGTASNVTTITAEPVTATQRRRQR
jgi:hypothetical protein